MTTLTSILHFIVDTLGGLLLLMIILRFYLQMARADFYNPFSQTIVKITNPLLIPLRRVIPGVLGVDISSIVLAVFVQYFVTFLSVLIEWPNYPLFHPLYIVWGMLGILMMSTWIFFVCMVVTMISSFIAPYSQHPLLMLARQLIEPLCRPFRRLIPPTGGLDFSMFFAWMMVVIFQMVITGVVNSVGVSQALVIGL